MIEFVILSSIVAVVIINVLLIKLAYYKGKIQGLEEREELTRKAFYDLIQVYKNFADRYFKISECLDDIRAKGVEEEGPKSKETK